MANLNPSLHVLCLPVELEWSQLQEKLFGTDASHEWRFGGKIRSFPFYSGPGTYKIYVHKIEIYCLSIILGN